MGSFTFSALAEEPDAIGDGASSLPRPRRRRQELAWTMDEETRPLMLPAQMTAAVVIASVLAVGSVHVPLLAAVAPVALAAPAIALFRSAGARARTAVPAPALACAALALYSALQAMPLPVAWLEAIAPSTADVWARSLAPFGEPGPRWASLSLDPGASLVEALKWMTYAAVFTVASAFAARRGSRWGIAVVFVAAVAAALTTLFHGLAGATAVYGFYKPGFTALPWHIGPLLNTNNLAGYLNLGALAGLGLLLGHRKTLPQWILWPGVAAIVGIEITSASRGGVVLLPIGVAALALLTWRRGTEDGETKKRSTGVMLLAVLGGGLLAVLASTTGMWTELLDKNLSKLEMVTWARPLLRDHPWFGIGRGAFESVFPVYRRTPGNIVFTHAENFPAQWAAEWGLPVAIAALCFFAWAFAPRRLGVRRSAIAAGAFIGALVLLAQNLVDLGLEIPAIGIALAAVLGSLWGDAQRYAPRDAGAPQRVLSEAWARVGAGLVAVAGLASIVGAVGCGSRDVASDRDAIHEALAAKAPLDEGRAASLRGQLRQAMTRHPAEPYFSLAGAVLASRLGDQNPIPWIQRSLERGQVNGRAHLLLADVLGARGARRQALLELRLAIQDDPALTGAAGTLAARWARDFDELLAVVPAGKEGAPALSTIAEILASAGKAELRARCDREAIRRDPTLAAPRFREADARIQALAAGTAASICGDRPRCREEIVEHTEVVAAAEPNTSRAMQLRARLLVVEDRAEEAARMLQQSCDRSADRVPCLYARAQVAAKVKAPGAVEAASRDLLQASCFSPKSCADAATWLSGVRASRGDQHAALALLSRAAQEDPLDEGRWLRLADAASRVAAPAQAADALEKVARLRGGADRELQKRIDTERARVIEHVLTP